MKKALVIDLVKIIAPAIITILALGLQTYRAQAVSEERIIAFLEANKTAHETILKSIDQLKDTGTPLAQENSRQIAGLTATVNSLSTSIERLSRDVYRRATP